MKGIKFFSFIMEGTSIRQSEPTVVYTDGPSFMDPLPPKFFSGNDPTVTHYVSVKGNNKFWNERVSSLRNSGTGSPGTFKCR